MSRSYTTERYTSQRGTTTIETTEYRVSDGARWVKVIEETPKPFGFGYTRSTKVLRADFEGDREHRSTLKALEAALSDADVVMYVEPSSAPVKLDPSEVTGSVEEEPTIDLYHFQPGDRVHNGTSPTVYTVVKHRKDGKINLTSPSGRAITLRDDEISPAAPVEESRVVNPGPEDAPNDEVLDITFLGINADQSMSWCVTFADRVLQTVRADTRDEAIAAAIAGREADGLNQPMLPAFVIEPGYEEQAHPMSRRQEAVLLGISAELELTSSMDVLPPLEKLGDVVASLGDEGSRVAIVVDCEGFLSQVQVRYSVAGMVGWVDLHSGSASELYDRVKDAARLARRTVKPEDNGLLPE